MKRLPIALVAAVAAFALSAEDGEAQKPADATESPAARLERCKRLVERYQPSTVRVLYTFKLDEEGEPPDIEVYYMCPNCNNKHSRGVEYYFERNMPFEALGYALAPNRVLLQDLHVQQKWIKSIEVEFGGVKYPAKEVLRYPKEGGVLVETEKPVEGMKPLAFEGRGIPEKPSYFYVVREKGLTVSGIKGSGAAAFRHYAETGRDFYEGAANTLVVNEKDEAVTVALQAKVELGKEQFAPPSEWTSVPASSFDEKIAAMEKDVSKFVLPLYMRLESQSKDGRRSYSRGGGDEKYFAGFALANGEVLIPANLSAEDTARLNLVEYRTRDGAKTKLEFVGSLDEWGALIARFPDGKLPAGFSPVRFSAARPEELLYGSIFGFAAKNNGGKLKIKVREQILEEFKLSWGGAVVPDFDGGDSECVSAVLSQDGAVVATAFARRQAADRWSSRSTILLPSNDISALLAARSFNPEFVPRTETDRNRVAWIGVEAMRLTAEAAREKKVTEFLKDEDDGGLVTKVYPGTPAAKAGIKEGDVLLTVRPEKSQKTIDLRPDSDYGSSFSWSMDDDDFFSYSRYSSTPWPNAEGGVNGVFSRLGIGSKVVVAWVSDRTRREATMTLEQIPVHYSNARRSRNRDIGMTVCDMTYEVRTYFRLADDAPGVVVSKLKPGDPAAVAGLRLYEIITDVNGKPVKSAKEFGAAIKGQKELTFSVRRLTATRIVRISLSNVKDDKAAEEKK